MQPIFLITGPPAAGKTALSRELLARFERGLHLEVDALRHWVIQGLADSLVWTDETERQFQVSEEASLDVALRYQAAGYAVAVDHCRNLPRLESLVQARMAGVPVVKVCLLPDLEVNLARNRTRLNKDFDPRLMEDTIRGVSLRMQNEAHPPGWLVLDSGPADPASLADQVWPRPQPEPAG